MFSIYHTRTETVDELKTKAAFCSLKTKDHIPGRIALTGPKQ